MSATLQSNTGQLQGVQKIWLDPSRCTRVFLYTDYCPSFLAGLPWNNCKSLSGKYNETSCSFQKRWERICVLRRYCTSVHFIANTVTQHDVSVTICSPIGGEWGFMCRIMKPQPPRPLKSIYGTLWLKGIQILNLKNENLRKIYHKLSSPQKSAHSSDMRSRELTVIWDRHA